MRDFSEIPKTKLFRNLTDDEIRQLVRHTSYFISSFKKGAEIFPPDSPISHSGIILSGEIDVMHLSLSGDEELVGRNRTGDIIAPAFCITGIENNLSHFRAAKDSEILFLDIHSLLAHPVNESFYSKFIANLTTILATNNIILNRKIQLLTQKSLSKKLMTYFMQLSRESKSRTFRLSFTREQLAQYISSERSSVCRELGRLQDDGQIRVNGNEITILEPVG